MERVSEGSTNTTVLTADYTDQHGWKYRANRYSILPRLLAQTTRNQIRRARERADLRRTGLPQSQVLLRNDKAEEPLVPLGRQ